MEESWALQFTDKKESGRVCISPIKPLLSEHNDPRKKIIIIPLISHYASINHNKEGKDVFIMFSESRRGKRESWLGEVKESGSGEREWMGKKIQVWGKCG